MNREIFLDQRDCPNKLYPLRLLTKVHMVELLSGKEIDLPIYVHISREEAILIDSSEKEKESFLLQISTDVKNMLMLDKGIKDSKTMKQISEQIKEILDANDRRHSQQDEAGEGTLL